MVRSLALATLVSFGLVFPPLSHAQAPAPPAPRKAPRARPAAPAPAPARPAVAAPAPAPEPPPPPPTDVKAVTAYTQGAQVSQNTTYIRGPRQRVEFPGMVSLDQCDLQRTVMLNPATRRYRTQAYAGPAASPAATAEPVSPFGTPGTPMSAPGTGAPPRGGVVTVTTTLTDTLERQQMFGLEARRIRTVIVRQASKDACDRTVDRTEIDAWYVDLPKRDEACSRTDAPAAPPATGESCTDRMESKVVGEVTLGFPVKTVTVVTTGEGDKAESSTATAEVTALEITRLDAALFDVPADFVEAKSLAELAPSIATGDTLSDALFGSTADGTSQAAPKPAGVTRIGVLEPVNTSTRSGLQMRALRQELVTQLTKAPFQALPLKGSSPEEIAADMSRLQCDYVLLAEVTEVKTSKPGRIGGMLKAASGGGAPRDRHEVKIAYRLFPADGTATLKARGEVKADSGGGFGVGSALRAAAFAGQMYMGFGGMGMMRGLGGMGGLGLGMMNPMSILAASGGMGAMGGTFTDPRSAAMASMAMNFAGGAGMPSSDPADQEIFHVASEAAGDAAKGVTGALGKAR